MSAQILGVSPPGSGLPSGSANLRPVPHAATSHVVSLSGGMGSAMAAERVIQRVGPENVTLWFADTRWEDPDLYRFLNDLEARWGIPILRHTEGETPLEVGERHHAIP